MGVARNILNWYAKLSPARGVSKPPFEHVVQIGDPLLRKVSEPVPMEKIKTKEIQQVISKLEYVISRYGSIGMSAPQIGVNLRIFAIRHTHEQLAGVERELVRLRGLEVIPFTVFINPKIRIVDYQRVSHDEGCESVQGYTAEVPRYRAVGISAMNPEGEHRTRVYRDWAARVIQHEMDHLDGKLYTDIMDRRTLTCSCWKEVNLSKGRLVIPFCPN